MPGLSKSQFATILVTLCVVSLATFFNLRGAYMRSRDVTRKNDIRDIHDALIAYRNDYASFPTSEQGKIVACFGGYDEEGIPQRRICEWVDDPLPDIFDLRGNEGPYLQNLPTDPKHVEGRRYLYLSNGRYFQIFAALERRDQPEYSPKIVSRNLMCGNVICNYGRASDGAPLDITIEEYEGQLRMKNKIE